MKSLALSTLLLAAVAASEVAQYTGGDTTGCGKRHILKGVTEYRKLKSGGMDRTYGIHIPLWYDKHHAYPTILGFHGSSSIGFFFQADTRLNEPRFTRDKIMVYPDGLGGAWAGANYSEASVAQDLQFVWDLLADVRHNYCIDSARIYATGLSMGGGFVDTIACNDTVGGEFAAFAPAAGAFYTNNDFNYPSCKPARVPTPILEFHGGEDASVKYEGGQGEGGSQPSIPRWLSRWVYRNECEEPHKRQDLFDGDAHHLGWTCQGQEGAVQHYKTDDQKHNWPSTEINFSQLASGDGPTHLQASAIIQDFFMNFTRPAE